MVPVLIFGALPLAIIALVLAVIVERQRRELALEEESKRAALGTADLLRGELRSATDRLAVSAAGLKLARATLEMRVGKAVVDVRLHDMDVFQHLLAVAKAAKTHHAGCDFECEIPGGDLELPLEALQRLLAAGNRADSALLSEEPPQNPQGDFQ